MDAMRETSSGRGPFSEAARWIWDEGDEHPRNAWLLFRRDFEVSEAELESAALDICADSRYEAYLNGARLGGGPIRSWPDSLYVDRYRVAGAARPGANRLEVLVNHYGLGSCAYIEGPAGLVAELSLGAPGRRVRRIGTDASWLVSAHPGYQRVAPKMANGLSWSEVYRADKAAEEGAWDWRAATEKSGPEYGSRRFQERDIDYLTDEGVYPEAVLSWRRVERRGFVRSVNLRSLAFPGELDMNKHKLFRGFLAFGLSSDRAQSAEIAFVNDPHDTRPLGLNLNGQRRRVENGAFMRLDLPAGESWVLLDLSGMYHDPEFHLAFDLPEGCSLAPLFEAELGPAGEGSELAFLGPFGSLSRVQAGSPLDLELPPSADYDRLAAAAGLEELLPFAEAARRLGPELVAKEHVALESYYQRPLEELSVPRRLERLCRPNAEDEASSGEEIQVAEGGGELVLDFGRELSGYLEFELEAGSGAVVDFFCYESQHDGIIEHTFSLNNSLRYVCGGGRQRYRSPVRRGFRYCKLTAFAEGRPLRVLSLRLMLATYPVTMTGRFRSSDFLLNRIWEISRHTVRLCMEDTFVDCPAYEQTLWTGDSYSSSLFSHYLFGRYEFPAHGNRLAARSLERSPLVESTIPSAWQNVIPNWAFLWVQSCVDHYLYSGDRETFEELFPSLLKTLRNCKAFIPESGPLAGLFAIDAWNFIDWASLDSPDTSDAAVAHQNAILVWTLRRLAKAAGLIGRASEKAELELFASRLGSRADEAFWSAERGAYVDCLRAEGGQSASLSLHSQLFMHLAGIGSEERRRRIAACIAELPSGFVDIASPFARLFHFQALLDMDGGELEGRVLPAMREIWGSMLRRGATSCWEGWSFIPGHYTRSHCHAWSASPAYFLGAYVLGLRPIEPGFASALLSPRFDSLSWLEGAVPTPHGLVELKAEAVDGGWKLSVEAPARVKILFRSPPGFRREGASANRAGAEPLLPEDGGAARSRYGIRLVPD